MALRTCLREVLLENSIFRSMKKDLPSLGTYVQIGMIQRRIAWPLRKNDAMNTNDPAEVCAHTQVAQLDQVQSA